MTGGREHMSVEDWNTMIDEIDSADGGAETL
jgi:hypothetical protein